MARAQAQNEVETMKSGKGEALRIFSIPTGGKKDKGDGKADRKAPKRKMKSKR